MDLQELLDRAEIADLITAYTRAVDQARYAEAAVVFTDDAVLDYTKAGGPAADPTTALAWVAEMMDGAFLRWQHIIGQVEYAFDGPDRARVTAYFTNPMVADSADGERLIEVGGYYHHEVVRTPEGWRSRRMVDDLVWTR